MTDVIEAMAEAFIRADDDQSDGTAAMRAALSAAAERGWVLTEVENLKDASRTFLPKA